MKLVMHLNHDLSYKMCGTRELFLAFLGLNRAFGFILCIMFLSWLINIIIIIILLLPKDPM